MADISTELGIIQRAEYGEQVRTAIHDAIFKINQESGGGGEEGAMSMRAGVIQRSLYGRGQIIDAISGIPSVKKTSDYEGIVPQPVYDAVEYIYNNMLSGYVGTSIDDLYFIYVRQGRARPTDSRDNWYSVYASVSNSFRIASNGNSLFPYNNFYDVMCDATLYFATAGITGFNPEQETFGVADTRTPDYYKFTQSFSNCYSYINGEQENMLPFPCYAALDPGGVICYDAEIKICSA